MNSILTPSNIVFVLGLIGTIFGVYTYFRDPQIAMDKRQELDKQEVENKALMIEERSRWYQETSDKKFLEMGTRINEAFTLAQNHTHTVDVKVDKLIESVMMLSNGVTKLSTIMDERLPKK